MDLPMAGYLMVARYICKLFCGRVCVNNGYRVSSTVIKAM